MNETEVNILRAILSGYNQSFGWAYWEEDYNLTISGFGHVSCLEAYIPVEDSGRPASLVFSVLRDGEVFYFRKTAYYDSYEGVLWNTGEFRQVKPVEKVVYDYV